MNHRYHKQQSGVALVVALIFLVILTLLGITALSNSTLQTRMTFGAAESNLAFQSAETALSSGESWLYSQSIQPTPGCAILNTANTAYSLTANCGSSAETAAAIWPRPKSTSGIMPPVGKSQYFDEGWWTTYGRKYGYTYVDNVTPTADATQIFASSSVNDTPRYVIEELGTDTSGSLVVGQGQTYRIVNYQITARSFGAQASTRTVTQSVLGASFE